MRRDLLEALGPRALPGVRFEPLPVGLAGWGSRDPFLHKEIESRFAYGAEIEETKGRLVFGGATGTFSLGSSGFTSCAGVCGVLVSLTPEGELDWAWRVQHAPGLSGESHVSDVVWMDGDIFALISFRYHAILGEEVVRAAYDSEVIVRLDGDTRELRWATRLSDEVAARRLLADGDSLVVLELVEHDLVATDIALNSGQRRRSWLRYPLAEDLNEIPFPYAARCDDGDCAMVMGRAGGGADLVNFDRAGRRDVQSIAVGQITAAAISETGRVALAARSDGKRFCQPMESVRSSFAASDAVGICVRGERRRPLVL